MAAPMTCDNVAQWVEKIFAPTYIREESNYHFWCAQWWAHPEAVARLEALWLTWEAAIAHSSPYAMADWLRDYLDRLVPPLLVADGPFSSCRSGRKFSAHHHDQEPLPVEPAPASAGKAARPVAVPAPGGPARNEAAGYGQDR